MALIDDDCKDDIYIDGSLVHNTTRLGLLDSLQQVGKNAACSMVPYTIRLLVLLASYLLTTLFGFGWAIIAQASGKRSLPLALPSRSEFERIAKELCFLHTIAVPI